MACVAVIGAGAIGQFYGAQLMLAGHAVHLLARRDAGALRANGLRLRQTACSQIASSAAQPAATLTPAGVHVEARALAACDPDWLLLALKTTALPDLPRLLAPFAAGRARVAVLCNGLGVEDAVARLIPPARIFGVLCFVCVNRDEDGTVRHLGHGRLQVGHLAEDAAERDALAALWRGAGVACDVPASLLEARWRKLGWNIPYNGLCTVHRAPTDRILADPAWRAESHLLMAETIAIGNADLAAHGRPERIEPEWAAVQEERTRSMGDYHPSTLLDLLAGREREDDALFHEPLRRARRLGVAAPALERLVAALPG